MRLKGEEYEQRLMSFKQSTLVLMPEITVNTWEDSERIHEITTNSKLTEEQVVAALKRLKAEYEIQ